MACVLRNGHAVRALAVAIQFNRGRSSHARYIQRSDCIGDASCLVQFDRVSNPFYTSSATQYMPRTSMRAESSPGDDGMERQPRREVEFDPGPIEPLLGVDRAAHLLGISTDAPGLDSIPQDRLREGGNEGHDPPRDNSQIRREQHPARRDRMRVFKRSGSRFYFYKFQCKGKEYYRSTGTANRRDAEDIAATAHRSIIRQLAGLEEPEAQQPPRRADERADSSAIPTHL